MHAFYECPKPNDPLILIGLEVDRLISLEEEALLKCAWLASTDRQQVAGKDASPRRDLSLSRQ